jgi:integrase
MPKKRLTAAFADRVRPPAKDEDTYFDLGFPGLALRVFYGGSKSWTFFYRIGGRLRRTSLGTYPAMSLLEARDAWRDARQSVAKGIDPSPRHGTSRTDTFGDVVAEWMRRDQVKNRASTIYQTNRLIEVNLLPVWGSRRVDTITARDIIELLDSIADRGAPTQAGRVHAHLHRFFGWCIRRGILTANPISTVDKPGSYTSRERVLTDAEIIAVWSAATQASYGPAMRLLLLTGARLQEISRLRESEIAGDTIKLEGERTKGGKPHTIPLSSAARAVLKDVPRGSSGEYLFSNDDGKRPVTAWGHAKGKIDAVAEIEPWRIHDLRRTVATGLQKLGVNLQTIEAVLGHVGGSRSGIVGVYQRHSFDTEKRTALEAWGAHVMDLVEGREPGKVLPMRGKQ